MWKKWREIHNLGLVNRVSDGPQEIDVDQVNCQFASIPLTPVDNMLFFIIALH